MKKFLLLPVIALCLLLSGCYDASEVEETAYLIALGIDNAEGKEYSYTFQFAAPLGISGGGGGGEEKKSGGGGSDSENSTVKNIVISAPDFYTAKNLLANYLSKTLNMSHLKLIVCSDDFAKSALKNHSELFAQEREIRPGTFMAVSKDRAEQFLKAVNPDLEGSTSKYYELSNSEKTLVFAPSVRLGDFVSNSKTFDKSTVLPVAVVDKEKNATELFGMGIFQDGLLKGEMSGEEAKLYNILSGAETRFTFSVEDKKNPGEMLSFDTLVLKNPRFMPSEEAGKLKITAELYINMEFIGARLPAGYSDTNELLRLGEQDLKKRMTEFLIKTAKEYSADILKIERFYKARFLTSGEMERRNFSEKYKDAVFYVDIRRSNKSGSTISGEIN